MQAFYKLVYPQRSALFVDRFEWRYRVGYDPKVEPVMAVLPDDRVVGQAAMIPVRMHVDGAVRPASWFIDFIVAPEMQRKGIGQVLTKGLMELCDIWLGQPNDQSIGVLEKYGWKQQLGCYRFAYPINLVNVLRYRGLDPRVAACATVVQPFYRLLTRTIALRRPAALEVQPLRTVQSELTAIVKDDGQFSLVRDRDWLHWRLVDSPVASEYFHATVDDAHLILRVFASGGLRRAHILYLSDYASEAAVRALVARLIGWAFDHAIDLVWTVCSHPMLVGLLEGMFPSKLPVRFAYHAVGETGRSFEQRTLSLHAMDSDADIVYGG